MAVVGGAMAEVNWYDLKLICWVSLNTKSAQPNLETTAKKSKETPVKRNLLLSIAGRASMDSYGKPSLIYIRRDIQKDIEKHCSGSKQKHHKLFIMTWIR